MIHWHHKIQILMETLGSILLLTERFFFLTISFKVDSSWPVTTVHEAHELISTADPEFVLPLILLSHTVIYNSSPSLTYFNCRICCDHTWFSSQCVCERDAAAMTPCCGLQNGSAKETNVEGGGEQTADTWLSAQMAITNVFTVRGRQRSHM